MLAMPLLKKTLIFSQSASGDGVKAWPLAAGRMSGISDLHLVVQLISTALQSKSLF